MFNNIVEDAFINELQKEAAFWNNIAANVRSKKAVTAAAREFHEARRTAGKTSEGTQKFIKKVKKAIDTGSHNDPAVTEFLAQQGKKHDQANSWLHQNKGKAILGTAAGAGGVGYLMSKDKSQPVNETEVIQPNM